MRDSRGEMGLPRQRIMIPEAFKILPPLSPELPAPPRAPPPHRVAPPVTRREKTAFVILNDETPQPGSRGSSPSGRVSPFRGRGFREKTSRHASRDPSPSPERARKALPRNRSRSSSRLPVATPRTLYANNTSNGLLGGSSGIPKPIYRRNSLSPSRTTQVLNQVNRNKLLKSTTQGKHTIIKTEVQSPRHSAKAIISPKRVGPEISKPNLPGLNTRPPIPKITQGAPNVKNIKKENEKTNTVTSPNRQLQQSRKPESTKSPSRIPRNRSISRGREGNMRASSPVRAVVRASPTVHQGSKKHSTVNEDKRNAPNGDKQVSTNVSKRDFTTRNKKGVTNYGKSIAQNVEKRNKQDYEKGDSLNSDIKKDNVKNAPNITPPTPVEEKSTFNLELDHKIPPPIEAVVSTLQGTNDTTPEVEIKEIQETVMEVQPQHQEQSPPPVKPSEEDKPLNEPNEAPREVKEKIDIDFVSEPSVTLVQTTTAPALELAQPDVIPNILSTKGEQEISTSVSEEPSEEDQDENPGGPKEEVVASVESVRSNSSVETVRAAASNEEVEVLSANNLMKGDSHNRSVAWDKTPDMSPLNNSVHPMDSTLPLQPPKPTGCCGQLCNQLCCRSLGKVCCCIKSPNCCSKIGHGLGALCSKLNCCKKLYCSGCCGKTDKPKLKPSKQRSRLRDCLSRLNCFRCCKSQPQPSLDEEKSGGCCAGCRYHSCTCFRTLFCLNRACCQRLRACCRCTRFGVCRSGGCCGPTPPQLDRRKSRLSVRKSQTSITQGIPKLDPTLVEHQSMMRGAVPVLPVPLAWFCCILNIFLPGSGTLFSGVFCMCFGKPRFSVNDSYPSRLTAFLINIVVAVSQLFTVIFCLVGWGWSIWWGVMMVRFAKKHKRILMAERAGGEQPLAAALPVAVNQNHDLEMGR